MIKMMIAAAGLSLGLLMMPVASAPAKAGVNIDINIGGKKQISCGSGRRLVEDYGYWRVRARNCSGRYYTYYASRRDRAYIVTVDSRRARIVDARRLYY